MGGTDQGEAQGPGEAKPTVLQTGLTTRLTCNVRFIQRFAGRIWAAGPSVPTYPAPRTTSVRRWGSVRER